jgi:hypothetical protein
MCRAFANALPCAVDQGLSHNELYLLADSLPNLIGFRVSPTLVLMDARWSPVVWLQTIRYIRRAAGQSELRRRSARTTRHNRYVGTKARASAVLRAHGSCFSEPVNWSFTELNFRLSAHLLGSGTTWPPWRRIDSWLSLSFCCDAWQRWRYRAQPLDVLWRRLREDRLFN